MHLQRIFPGVKSKGIVLTIPMPGHPLSFSPDKTIPSGDKDPSSVLSPSGIQLYIAMHCSVVLTEQSILDVLHRLSLLHCA
jgi:hypothetical protein